MTVSELPEYFKKNRDEIKRLLRERKYRPSPVRRAEIPKPDGGMRLLGIATAVDRVIQQAINQVLVPIYEKKFSDNSFGFRRGRNAKMAIKRCKEYIEEGYTWVVDIDLAKYFDTVNHDKLMRLIYDTIEDGDLLSIIRKYLTSGVVIDGVKFKTEKGCPQGGTLSPMDMKHRMNKINQSLMGWVAYFALENMRKLTLELDQWLRRRIRMCYWKQWKKIGNRQKNLVKLGIKKNKTWEYSNTRKSYRQLAGSFILSTSLTNEYLSSQGLKSINERCQALH